MLMQEMYVDGSVISQAVAAKSRVATLNDISIPCLGFMVAVLGLRLAKIVGHTLELPPANWTLCSDIIDVLYWITGRSRNFKQFVANRVGEIQNSTNPMQWGHVPIESNPVGLLSRGITVAKLTEENMWWTGPTFLCTSPDEWPRTKSRKGGHMIMKGANRIKQVVMM